MSDLSRKGPSFRAGRINRKWIAGIAVLLTVGILTGGFFLFRGFFAEPKPVTVSFDSTGGSAAESVTVLSGEKIAAVPQSDRPGYVFAGWYYEPGPIHPLQAEDVFSADTTLYAAWYESDMQVDRSDFLRNCESDVDFIVRSEAALNTQNVSGYIRLSILGTQELVILSVEPLSDGYRIYCEEGFVPGYSYSIELLDPETTAFLKAGEKDVSTLGITNYTFNIYKENFKNMVAAAAPKSLILDAANTMSLSGIVEAGATGDARDDGKEIFRVTVTDEPETYQAGDLILLGSDGQDPSTAQYYKVLITGTDENGAFLELIAPNMDDVYSEYELFYDAEATYFEPDEVDTEEMEAELTAALNDSEVYDDLCVVIAQGIHNSPTLLSEVEKLSPEDRLKFENLSVASIADLFKNVRLSIEFGKTKDLALNDNGCYGIISFTTGDISIPLSEDINLTINLTVKESVTATISGWQVMKGSDFITDTSAYVNNKFELNFNAVVATDSGSINITEEIQNLINDKDADRTQQIVDKFNEENFFGESLDYVELLTKELGNKTITIYEVLTIQFKLEFKVSMGMRAGLELNLTCEEDRKIGMNNVDYSASELKSTDMRYINSRLRTNVHFEAMLRGQLGIRAGFALSVNFSFLHLNDVLNLGFSAEVGVYEEIAGFLRFTYDYLNEKNTADSKMSLAGGFKSETGIYIELSFTWNLFGWEDNITIAEFKFPILIIGTMEFASEFKEPVSNVTFDTRSFNLKNNGNYLDLKYVSIEAGSGGVTVEVKPAPLQDSYAFSAVQDQTGKGGKEDLKYVSVDMNSGMVTIAENAPDRLDFTVVVQYTKGSALFSDNLELITKTINCTYMKYKVADSSVKYNATFYLPDGSVLEQKTYYVGQQPVPPDESAYEEMFVYGKYKIISWSRPWKEDIQPIYSDTEYHLDVAENLRNIKYYGDVYDSSTGTYRYGLIATIPSLCGELPVTPTPENLTAAPGWEFCGWSPDLRKVDADYSYTAIYSQAKDACRTCFYTSSGQLISSGFVTKGTMPTAPDMSAYDTDETYFAGWLPGLHASSENSANYYAVIRKYISVTFEDRYGKTITSSKVEAGQTPAAPETDTRYDGESDYFEYRFAFWETVGGEKLGPVYKDTVYRPKYKPYYFEVTTVFDAGAHTFDDGTSRKEFRGTYAPYNFLYMPQIRYRDSQNSYVVDYWVSTTKVGGEYVRLYMNKFHTDYIYNLTFVPVFKTDKEVTYTVRFDGGDEIIYITGQYGDLITKEQLSGLHKTSNINNYDYVITDYGVPMPYSIGSIVGADGLPSEYVVAQVVFEAVGHDMTYVFDAAGGLFADNAASRTRVYKYGDKVSFTEAPVRADDAYHSYVFNGWSTDKDAASGSLMNDFVANGNYTHYAIYIKTPREYKLSYNAGAGYFAGGAQTLEQSYLYEELVVLPASPTRDADATYRYVFIGWDPEVSGGTPVREARSYTAVYRAIRIDGVLEETGVIVSSGGVFEDICVVSIPGYTYALIGTEQVPTLTVTGNGLTFSGTSNEVCIIIASGVTDVTFDGLTLSGQYSFGNGVLDMEESDQTLTISVIGQCTLHNTSNGRQGARFERPIRLLGQGSGAQLSFSAKGYSTTVYCAKALTVESMTLEIIALKRDGDPGYPVTTISGDGDGGAWLFSNATIRFTSEGNGCEITSDLRLENTSMTVSGEQGAMILGDLTLVGSTTMSVTAQGADGTAVSTGQLTFEDFSGTFRAESVHATQPGVAVIAADGIRFIEGGTEVSESGYNLGGLLKIWYESGAYYSFGTSEGGAAQPAAAVSVSAT